MRLPLKSDSTSPFSLLVGICDSIFIKQQMAVRSRIKLANRFFVYICFQLRT
jgi:hypothetical protein